jgi:multidrug resistance efflux pump
MLRKLVLPALAAGLFLFAVLHVVKGQQVPPRPAPPVEPARTPYGKGVAGAGLVEPQTENISVGSHLPGVVKAVYVKAGVGQTVKDGDVLFELDDRNLLAEREVRRAARDAAVAQLRKLEQMPRPEELPASRAKVGEAEANDLDQQDQLRRAETLVRTSVIGEEEMMRRRMAAAVAKAQLARARADDALLRAGAWAPDKTIAQAAVDQADAQVRQTEVELGRLKVTAVMPSGVARMEVLQVNVRPGEYVGAPPGQALVVLGNLSPLHVRVDVDEHDIPRWDAGRPARAALRGDPRQTFPLRYVRTEPYVVPKKSLTGDNTERVDTRVLQVIYAVEGPARHLFVGQQVDVFIDGDAGRPR